MVKKHPIRVLFVCKRRHTYTLDDSGPRTMSSGLLNSATFVSDMLGTIEGVESKVVDVEDNNHIDREVALYKPTHVIIEALWVVPEKFKVLTKLHPNVKWIIRLHSDLPFLAGEGIAIDWLFKYKKYGLYFIANCPDTSAELEQLLGVRVVYLPNYYPVKWHLPKWDRKPKTDKVHIGCFGAIRPLKNQLVQAIAAIRYADKHRLKLRYYINTGRLEMCGEPVYRNIRALFDHTHHKLVELSWANHDEFIRLLKDKIDIGLQVSFSETFNIVSADMVMSNVPIVVSEEVYWVSPNCMVEPYLVGDIVEKMEYVQEHKRAIVRENKRLLAKEDVRSRKRWGAYFGVRADPTWGECLACGEL